MSKKKQSRAPARDINGHDAGEHCSGSRKQATPVRPRNAAQKTYLGLLRDDRATIVLATGPAGTGKTMLAVHEAALQFKEGAVDAIVVTRPAVGNDEEHGFLPGDIAEKMEPWVRPMTDILSEHFQPTQINTMLKYGRLEFSPLAFMRGRTFKRAFVIADEMQNSSPEQMKMLLTRIGDGSRLAVTGDLEQHDRGRDANGLGDFTERLGVAGTGNHHDGASHIRHVSFGYADIERHPAVAEVLELYGDA